MARPSICIPIFAALSWPDERGKVTKAARGYLHHRSREKKPGTKISAQNFLREPESWDGWAKLAPPDIQRPTWIAERSQEFAALRVLAKITGEPTPEPRVDLEKGEPGIWRKHPITADLLGLAVFAEKPVEEWTPIEPTQTQPWGAWCSRIEKWIGRRPEPMRVLTGGEHPFEWNGQTSMVKNFVMGLRVPWLYPPLKDGSLSKGTGPPH